MALFNPRHLRKPGFSLALFGSIFAISVLALGAFTRLVDAGLGCPDWPGCYGHALWPNSAEEIGRANEAFPDAPVELDKTWPEMVHRYLAKSLGLITIGIYALSLRGRSDKQPIIVVSILMAVNLILTAACMVKGAVMEPIAARSIAFTMIVLAFYAIRDGTSERPFKLSAFLLVFIILQGLFGMWTVTLKLWPQVVTSHLLGGFTTLSLLWLMTLRLNNMHWSMPEDVALQIKRLRPLAIAGLVIVSAQVALGGWTTSNYAAVACPDLPTCQGKWIPPMDFVNGFNLTQSIGPNYLGGIMDNDARVAIHMSHRIGAIITTIYLVFLSWILIKQIALPETKRMGLVILAVLALQVALGFGNVLFAFPVWIAVAHNLGGALLLLTQVTLMHRIFTVKQA